jgi:hypothetical protein
MALSKFVLERSRSLVIRSHPIEGYPDCKVLEIKDPLRNGKVIDSYIAKTPLDVERIRKSWMASYRVPKELVIVESTHANSKIDDPAS